MRAAGITLALVAVCGCRGSHVTRAKPQRDPIGHLEHRCEHGKLDDCVVLAEHYERGWRFDPDDYDEEEEEWDDRHLRDRDVEYETSSARDGDVLIPPYSGPPRTVLAVDLGRARTLYAHACTGNERDACYALGRMRRDGLGGAADLAAADADFVHACNLGELRACTAHAFALENGLGIPADPDAGHALMRQLCDEDDHARACVNVGVRMMNNSTPLDDRDAQAYFRQACYGDGDSIGCHYMASTQLRDEKRRSEHRRALHIEEDACEEGIGAACAVAGAVFRDDLVTDDGFDGLGLDESERSKRSADLFRHGCDLGDADACQGYFLALFDGDGVRQNVVAAARIAGQQCSAGHVGSCQSLGYFYEVGAGVPQDLARAEELYRAACDTNTLVGAGSCSNLAELAAERGDDLLAVALAMKGCNLGDMRGCNVGGLLLVTSAWPRVVAFGEAMLRRACRRAPNAEDKNEYCAAAAGIR